MEATAVSLTRTVLDGVLGSAGTAMADEAALLLGVRREVAFIRSELQMMRSFLRVQSSSSSSAGAACKDTVQTCVKQVRDLACDLEDCLLDFTLHASRARWLRWGPGLAARHRVAGRIRIPGAQGQRRGAQPAQPALQRLRRRQRPAGRRGGGAQARRRRRVPARAGGRAAGHPAEHGGEEAGRSGPRRRERRVGVGHGRDGQVVAGEDAVQRQRPHRRLRRPRLGHRAAPAGQHRRPGALAQEAARRGARRRPWRPGVAGEEALPRRGGRRVHARRMEANIGVPRRPEPGGRDDTARRRCPAVRGRRVTTRLRAQASPTRGCPETALSKGLQEC